MGRISSEEGLVAKSSLLATSTPAAVTSSTFKFGSAASLPVANAIVLSTSRGSSNYPTPSQIPFPSVLVPSDTPHDYEEK